MGQLFVVRHASTALNSNGDEIRGWKDIPLSAEGREETHTLAKSLIPHKIDGIISSDLSRAHDTAKEISKETGAPILLVTMELRPWNVGVLQGKKFAEIKDDLFKLFDNMSIEVAGGESFNSFKTRGINMFRKLGTYRDKNLAIVTHHRNERLLDAWYSAGGMNQDNIDVDKMKVKGQAPGSFRITNFPK